MYDKLQLTNFDFIYDAKKNLSVHTVRMVMQCQSRKVNVMYRNKAVQRYTKNRVMSVNVDESENVLCSDVL